LLQIRKQGVYAAGIVLSAYSTEVAIVTATGELVAHRAVRIRKTADGQKAVITLAEALNTLIDELALPRSRIIGVGISVAAHLDPEGIRAVSAGYLGWQPFNLVEPVSRITGLFAKAENIVNALTLAETSVGVARHMSDVIVVRNATTIGATILQHGQIIRGHGFRAGRIGHFHRETTPFTCSCGRNDCLNCSASGWSVLARLGIIKDPVYRPDNVAEYANAISALTESAGHEAKQNNAHCEALRNAGAALAGALQLLNQTIEPEAIILAGSMSRAPAYRQGIRQSLDKTDEGQAALAKIQTGEIRAVRAAAILALLERIYSPALDFDALCASAQADLQPVAQADRMTGTD
jgi:glucokinase